LIENRQPACSSACPTGALKFGQLTEPDSDKVFSWFPDKKLNPAIEFTANQNHTPLKIIPENIYEEKDTKPDKEGRNITTDLSLIIFTFLATISVATIISSLIKGVFPEKIFFPLILLIAGFASFFHLGKKLRSWRSVRNLRNSPLSREIAAFIVFALVASVSVIFHIPGLIIASSVIGLILLLLIDSVYIYTDRSKSVILHSGQTFISALLIVSFISGIILPFIFVAFIKLVSSVHSLYVKKLNSTNFGIRFLRIAFLFVPGISLILHNSNTDRPVIFIFLMGELLDRILFYIDFNPLNINTLIDNKLNIERDEKKRC
jgi:DMSO reductase anchor subunit